MFGKHFKKNSERRHLNEPDRVRLKRTQCECSLKEFSSGLMNHHHTPSQHTPYEQERCITVTGHTIKTVTNWHIYRQFEKTKMGVVLIYCYYLDIISYIMECHRSNTLCFITSQVKCDQLTLMVFNISRSFVLLNIIFFKAARGKNYKSSAVNGTQAPHGSAPLTGSDPKRHLKILTSWCLYPIQI